MAEEIPFWQWEEEQKKKLEETPVLTPATPTISTPSAPAEQVYLSEAITNLVNKFPQYEKTIRSTISYLQTHLSEQAKEEKRLEEETKKVEELEKRLKTEEEKKALLEKRKELEQKRKDVEKHRKELEERLKYGETMRKLGVEIL